MLINVAKFRMNFEIKGKLKGTAFKWEEVGRNDESHSGQEELRRTTKEIEIGKD